MAAFFSFEFIAVVSFQSVLTNFDFWLVTTNLISISFFFLVPKNMNPKLHYYENIRNCLFPLLFPDCA